MYERLLVPLDGSRVAELALDHAAELARRFKSDLVLLRVVFPRELTFNDPDSEQADLRLDMPGTDAEVSSAQEYVSGLARTLSAEGIRVSEAVTEGDAAEEIVRQAAATGTNLIVMSTHGHGGLKRGRLGSVARAVLELTTIPLLILPYR